MTSIFRSFLVASGIFVAFAAVQPATHAQGFGGAFSSLFSDDDEDNAPVDVSANIASAITWEASPSAGLTLDNTHGKVVNVTPTQTGTWTLTANIAGYDGGMPSFQFDAVEETTTMVYAYILGTNGDYRTTPAEVTNL
ncbi:MAG: hypothetical protein IKX19_09720, partial [Clostridia bacterium]|nr:hypothetical protein [Clostridia bacterium]